MLTDQNIKRIVISGPESTGKSDLTQALAEKFQTRWIPEYAREYVQSLNHPYQYQDVVRIARRQISHEETIAEDVLPGNILFFDTWLIITKVWFDLVYGKCPEFVLDHIRCSKIDLFLVCNTDLPWIADQVRENGGEKREELLQLYCNQIRSFGFNYELISGSGEARTENAIRALSAHGMNLRSDTVVYEF